MPTVIPTIGSYTPLAQRYNQLQAGNNVAASIPTLGVSPTQQDPNSTAPNTSTGTIGNYDYASAIQDRLKSIGQLGTNANAIQARKLSQQQGAQPANYNVGGPFQGNLKDASAERQAIVKKAESYRGMWYKWGGANPSTSFDCSGLVQYVYGRFGIHLPRISNQQAMVGRQTNIRSLKPGDLVAWDNSTRNKGADHIAIYVGNGMVMEAAHTGSQLRVRRLGSNEGAWGVSLSQYLG